jgi:hypothetical protein
MTSGEPDPFWDDVRKHVTSWLIVCGVGGIGWLSVQVPIRLDRLLANQESIAAEVREFKLQLRDLEIRMDRQERAR